jgi:translation initiation factor 4E
MHQDSNEKTFSTIAPNEGSTSAAVSLTTQDPKTLSEKKAEENLPMQSKNMPTNSQTDHLSVGRRQQHSSFSSSPAFNKNKKPKKQPRNKKQRNIPHGHHGLQSSWTFWYSKKISKPAAQYNWADTLKKLGTVDTIEGFWRFYTFLKRPSEISNNSSLSFFRGETPPMWENFPNGGGWTLWIKKRSSVINRIWEELLFACIGEWFEEPDIVGIVLSLRSKSDSITLWNKDSALRHRVGEKLRQVLRLDANCPMEYKFHSSAERTAVIRRQSDAKNNPPLTTQQRNLSGDTDKSQPQHHNLEQTVNPSNEQATIQQSVVETPKDL